MDMQAAKELFFRYDGSVFYMSRDGVDADYREAGIPRDVEAVWLDEMKSDKLRLLSQKGNWRIVYFFHHHSDLGHLADFIEAEPKGVLWERCCFLETLLKYAGAAREAGRDDSLVSEAVRKVTHEAQRLLKRARSDASSGRVRAVLFDAHQLLREIEAD